MQIQQIRNATLKIIYGGQAILLDPWLQDKGTGFSARALRSEMAGVRNPMDDLPISPRKILDGIDFCLVTHMHPDHFSADYLPERIKIIVQNETDKEKAVNMGFTNVTAFRQPVMTIGGITVTKVPALHGDNAAAAKAMGSVSGFILQGEARTLYIAGDTVYFDGVERILDSYHPNVIILNCCEAATPLGRLIMNLADVEAVCRKNSDAIVIATHLDSVNHALVTSDDVRNYARKKGLTQVRIPRNGEWIRV